MLDWEVPFKPQTWQDLYQAAVLESDPRNHLLLSNKAEEAIYKRLTLLEIQDHKERRSLQDALATLANLRRVRVSGSATSSGKLG